MWHALWLMLAMVTAGAGQEAGEPAVCSQDWFASMQRRSRCGFTPSWNEESARFLIEISAPEPTQNHWVELTALGSQVNNTMELTPQQLVQAYESGLVKRQSLSNGDWWYALEVVVTSIVYCPTLNIFPTIATVTTTTLDLFVELSGQAISNGTVRRYIEVPGLNASGTLMPSCGYYPTGGLKDAMQVFFFCDASEASQLAGLRVAEITDVAARSVGAGGEIDDQELLSDKIKVGMGISALLSQGSSFNPYFELYLDWTLRQDGRRRHGRRQHGRRQHGRLQDRWRRSNGNLGTLKVTFEQDESGVFHAKTATPVGPLLPNEPQSSPSPSTWTSPQTAPPAEQVDQVRADHVALSGLPSWLPWMTGNMLLAIFLANSASLYCFLELRREVRSLREILVEMKYLITPAEGQRQAQSSSERPTPYEVAGNSLSNPGKNNRGEFSNGRWSLIADVTHVP